MITSANSTPFSKKENRINYMQQAKNISVQYYSPYYHQIIKIDAFMTPWVIHLPFESLG